MLHSIFNREPTLLEPNVEQLARGESGLGAGRLRSVVAAIGAAERLLP